MLYDICISFYILYTHTYSISIREKESQLCENVERGETCQYWFENAELVAWAVNAWKKGNYLKSMEVWRGCKTEGYLLRLKDGQNCEIFNYQMLYKLVFMFTVQLLSLSLNSTEWCNLELTF